MRSGDSHPDFSTLDKQNKGTLSKADVKGHPWLSKHFAKCDTETSSKPAVSIDPLTFIRP